MVRGSEGKRSVAEAKVGTKLETKPGTKLEASATFVNANDDVPVDVRLAPGGPVAGASKAAALHAAAVTGTGQGAARELSAEQRLLHLIGRAPAPEASKAPKAAVLERAVANALGARALHLSALEVATVLGAPSWASAVKDLGACNESAGKQPHWLLAAHLSKWMQGIAYQGAPLADVARSFLAAHPDLGPRFPYLDGGMVAALQTAYPFMPQWTSSPAPVKAEPDWADWNESKPPDAFVERLDKALTSLAEVPLSMKLTSAMAEVLVAKQPFKDANVVMVQHMLGQANPLLDAMTRAGLDVTRAEYVGVPYQKNSAVRTTLEQGHGVKVSVPEVGNIDDMWQHITAAIDRAWDRHVDNGAPILVMDDGGYASRYIAEKYQGRESAFKVVEQTTRGLTEISKIPDVKHAIVDVAGSYGKRFESAQVGDAVKMAVRRVLDAVTTTPARKDILIVGAGKVGEGVAVSFAGDGARVSIYDPFVTPARAKELRGKGFDVITDKAKALDQKFLVIGCSGHRSIDMADFAKMSSPVFLASASSKRVEIDTIGLGELAKDKEGQLRKILAAKVNEQETWHYFLQDGRIITAMADGLPVNFQAVNSIAPELIDHTMALMLLGAAQAMTSTAAGLNALDPNAQFWLQAQMEGLTTLPSPLSDAGAAEITLACGERTFGGSRADWLRIAASPATPPAVLHDLLVARVAVDPMDAIALAILGSKHDLLDKTIDFALQQQCLPHIGRLLHNEGLQDGQEDRVLHWLENSFWAAAGRDHDIDDVANYRAVAVEGDARSGFKYLYADIIDVGGKHHLAHRVSTVADAVTSQTSDLLFGHPRGPAYLREVFAQKTYEIAGDGLASTVLRVKNPAWTEPQLAGLFEGCASAAWSRAQSYGKQQDFDYAYDLIEAFRDHPSASEQLQEQAEQLLLELGAFAEKRDRTVPRGSATWAMSALGLPLPEYR